MSNRLPPWRVNERAAGDFAVQRIEDGVIVRIGVYAKRADAQTWADAANRLKTKRVKKGAE